MSVGPTIGEETGRAPGSGETGRTTVNGVELAWTVRGDGPPLVLVHGFTGNQGDWDEVVDALAASHRVVRYDHRGHGESTNTGDAATYTIAQLADDLAALLDAEGLSRVDLVGHSMGGGVAMRFALAAPGRVRRLVLMDTGGRPAADDGSGARQIMRMGFELARDGGLQPVVDAMAPFMGEGPEADARRARVQRSFDHLDPVAFTTLGEELLSGDSVMDALATLAVPTLVLVGELDRGLRASADDLAATIPGARLVVIEGAGHSPQSEATEAWLGAVGTFLAP